MSFKLNSNAGLFTKYQNAFRSTACVAKTMKVERDLNNKNNWSHYLNLDVIKRSTFSMEDVRYEELSQRGLMNYIIISSWVVVCDNDYEGIFDMSNNIILGNHFISSYWLLS